MNKFLSSLFSTPRTPPPPLQSLERQRPSFSNRWRIAKFGLILTLSAIGMPALGNNYSGNIFGPVNVDDGSSIGGLASSTQSPTQNGNIRYQWRIVPTSGGDNRWLGFEWDSRTRIFSFYGNPTFTPDNNVIIDSRMDIGGSAYGWGNPGNFRINSVETGKTLIFNITDTGDTLSPAPGNDVINFALTEINHANDLVNSPDGDNTGLSTSISGNNVVLQVTNNAESNGSNEELWFQWTRDNFTTKNFIQVQNIAANQSVSIPLSTFDPGDTLTWLVALTGPSSTSTISGTTGDLGNFDVIAINKSTTVTYSVPNLPAAPTITGITPGNGQLSVAFTAGADGGAAITNYEYSTDNGSTWKSAGTTSSPFTITTVSGSTANLANGTTYNVRIRAVNVMGAGTASESVNGTPVAPTLNAVTLGSALSTTYGTASSGVSFTPSGSNLSGNITVTPQSGYEVSTTSSTAGFGSAAIAVANNTTVWIRFAATRAAGTYNSATAAVLSSAGADNQNVTTSGSGNTVAQKALTITGLSAANKTYNGNTTVSVTGTPTYSGLVNGETFSVSGSVTWAFPDKNVGNNKTLTRTGSYDAPSANYTVTQPTLTANITPLSITGSFTAANKTYDGTTTATVTSRSLTGVISGDTVTLTGGTATFDNATVGTGKTVTLTGATLDGTDQNNYTLGSVDTTTANITKADQTITFATGAWQTNNFGDANFSLVASASSGLAVSFASSDTGVATVSGSTVTIVGAGTTTITASQAGDGNYNAASSVERTLTVNAIAPTVSTTSATPSTPVDPTQANAGGNVTSSGGTSLSERGVVWNTTGTPTTSDNKVAHGSATTGSYTVTLTGLTPGETVYYRAYAINSADTAYGSTLEFTADCFTNAPTVSAASALAETSFTANWGSVPGATGYRLDVSTSETFAGGGGGDPEIIVGWDFDDDSLVATDGVAANLTQELATEGRSADNFINRAPGRAASINGWNAGADTKYWIVSFDATGFEELNVSSRQRSSNTGPRDFKLQYRIGATGTWTDVSGASITVANNYTTGALDEVPLPSAVNNESDVYLRWIMTSNLRLNGTDAVAAGGTSAIDDIYIVGTPAAGGFVPGFEDLDVGNTTSASVTGLTANVTYYYRVRAVGAGACVSDNSTTQTVTTTSATPTVTLADNGAQVGAANVAADTSNHLLHQFQVTIGVATTTMNQVSVTTDGTYAGSDISNLKLWYSTSSSFGTGTATAISTNTNPGAAGAKTFTGLTQALSIGTHYFYVTADIASGAIGGNTINIEAMTSAAIQPALGSPTGSATAGGAQTIVTAPVVTTTAASSISATAATLGGDVTSGGGLTVSERGVVYSTSSGVTIGDNKTTIGSGTGPFSQSISSLSVNTRYYFRAYAINTQGTTLGSELNFWTLANVPAAPTLSAPNTGGFSVAVNENSNPATTEFAIQVGSDYVQTDGTLGASEAWQTKANWGTRTVTGLSPNVQYTVSVKARNGANVETDLGTSASIWTLANAPAMPTLSSATADGFSVAVNENSNPATTEFAIQVGSDYVQADGTLGASEAWQTKANWGTRTVTGLSPNVQYSVSVKARNGANVETDLGTPASIRTLANVPAAPTVTAEAVGTLDVSVNANGNPTTTQFAIQVVGGDYVQANGTLGASAVWQTAAAWDSPVRVSMPNAGTEYCFEVTARNGDNIETDASDPGCATTWDTPTLTTPTATSIGQTTATLGASITSDGGTEILSRGTVWSTSPNPTANELVLSGTTTGVFTQARTGLPQGSQIYYAGFASNVVGKTYSAQGSFFTEPGQASNVTFSELDFSGVRISWTAGADSDGAIVVMRADSAVAATPTDGTLHTANAAFGSGADLGSSQFVVYRGTGTQVDVTNLESNTTYHVAVFAYAGTEADSGVNQGINYRQTSPATGSQTTLACAAIITQPDDVTTGLGTTMNMTVVANNSNPNYAWRKRGDGWGSGNGWSFTSGDGGFFVGDSEGNGGGGSSGGINTSARAWGFFNGGGAVTEVFRNFDAMSVGDVFQIDMDNGWNNGTVGMALQNSGGQNMVQFYNRAGDGYIVNRDEGELNVNSDIGFTTSGLRITITITSSTTFSMTVYRYSTDDLNGPYTGTFQSSGDITRLRLFNAGSSVDRDDNPPENYDLFFNNLSIGPSVDAPLFDDDASNYSISSGAWASSRGQGPLSDGGRISGADTDTLTIDNLVESDSGFYDVVVWNACGGEVSEPAELTVQVPNFGLRDDDGANLPRVTYFATGLSPDPVETGAEFEQRDFGDITSLFFKGADIRIFKNAGGDVTNTLFRYKVWPQGGEEPAFTDRSVLFVSETTLNGTTNQVWSDFGAEISALSGQRTLGEYNVVIQFEAQGTGIPGTLVSGPFTNTFTIPDAAAPTGVQAAADGNELVQLSWTNNPTYPNVMILHDTAPITVTPSNRFGYVVDDLVAPSTTARVIYRGTGDSMEHVVLPGTTNYYVLYSAAENYFSSAPVDTNLVMGTYRIGEIVETFSYPAGENMSGRNGGQGWSGAWYGDTSSFNLDGGSFVSLTNYPASAGNKVLVNPTAGQNPAIFRPLGQSYTNGQIYISYMVNYTTEGANFFGASLFGSNTTERLFFGKLFDSTQLGINGGELAGAAAGYDLFGGTGRDYIIIGKYDWEAGQASISAFNIGSVGTQQPVPLNEPDNWTFTTNVAANLVGPVDNVRLAAGGTDSPGNVFFDELRVATNWNDLLGTVPSKITAPASVCANSTGNTASVPDVAGATYGWAITGGSITGGGNTRTVTFSAAAGSDITLTAHVTNSLGQVGSDTRVISVNSVPGQPGTIDGPTAICSDTNGVVYTISAAAANATGYTWTVPPQGTIVDGQGTDSITVNFSGTPGGTVSVVGTNECGEGPARTLTVDLFVGATVTASPTNVTVCAGGNVEFNANATGDNLAFQWQVSVGNGASFSAVSLSGASGGTTTNLSLSDVDGDWNGYQFRLRVTGACGDITNSAAATLTVDTPPVITGDLSESVGICAGTNVSFSVTATGTGLSYQWQVNTGSSWSNVGGDANTYSTPALDVSDDGNQYRVIVSSSGICSASAVTSTVSTVSVGLIDGGTVTADDAVVVVGNGTTVRLNGQAEGSAIQWQSSLNGTDWTNISDATNATYATGALTTSTYFRTTASVAGCTPGAAESVLVGVRFYEDTWSGAGTGNNTLTDANWATGFYPEPSATSIWRFATSAKTTITNNYPVDSALGAIRFLSGADAFTLSGNAITLHDTIVNESSSQQALNMPMVLGGDVTVAAGSGTVALGGNISGAQSLTKTGVDGTLVLSGINTFSEGLFIDQGRVRLEGSGSGGVSNGVIYVSNNEAGTNATLEIAGGLTLYNAVVAQPLNSDTKAFIVKDGDGDAVIEGGLTLSASDGGGAREVRLINTNGTGVLRITGTVLLDSDEDNSSIYVEGPVEFTGMITNRVSGGLVVRGPGTLTVSGEVYVNIFQDSGTAVAGVGARFFGNRIYQLGTTDNVNEVTKDAELTFKEGNVEYDLNVAAGFFSDGGQLTPGTRQFTFTHTNDTVTLLGGVNLIGGGANSFLIFSNTLPVDIKGTLTGTGGVAKVGSGRLNLLGEASYTGETEVREGALGIASSTVGNGQILLGAGESASAVSLFVQTNATVNTDINVVTGEGARVIGMEEPGTASFANDANITLNRDVIFTNAANSQLTVDSAISGDFGITKLGIGSVVLSGENSYTGETTVSQGVMRVESANALGTTDGGTIVADGATLDYGASGATTFAAEPIVVSGRGVNDDGALRSDGGATARLRGSITLAADAEMRANVNFDYSESTSDTLSIDLDGHTLYLSGSANHIMRAGSSFANASKTTGDGAIVKEGSGFFTFRPTDVSGTIRLDGGEIRHAPGSMPSGGILRLADATTYSSDGGTTRTVPKDVVIAGNVALASFSSGGLTFSGEVDLDDGVRQVTVGNPVTMSGALSNGGLIKAGAGTLTLSGASTYTGATTIAAGTLALTGSGSLASTSIQLASNATFSVAGRSEALTLGAQTLIGPSTTDSVGQIVASGTAGLTLGSSSALVLPAFVDGTAPLNVDGGTLTLNSAMSVTVTNLGAALVDGDYKIISKGANGAVAFDGGAPTVTVTGLDGDRCVELVLIDGELHVRVASGIGIVEQPANQQVCDDDSATFTVSAPGATNYQWQVSTDGGTNWNYVTQGTGDNTDSYTTEILKTADSGRLYRVIVQGTCGGDTTSTAASVTVFAEVAAGSLSVDPADGIIVEGTTAALTSEGASGSIIWQVSADNESFTTIEGETSTSFTTPALTTDRWYRVVVTAGECGNATTDVVRVRVRKLDATWDGGGANDQTLTDENWAGNLAPAPGTTSIMRFAGSTRTSPLFNYSDGGPFGSIYFVDGASAFTVGGDSLTLHSLVENQSGAIQTLTNAITLGSTVTLDAAVGPLVLSSPISGGHGLALTGTNQVTLSGDSSFTGPVAVSNGILRVESDTALGTPAGGVSVSSGAVLELQGGRTIGAEPLTLNGTGLNGAGALRNVEGSSSFGGTISLASESSINVVDSTDVLSLNGILSSVGASANLLKIGAGTLELTENNTFTSQLDIRGGAVSVGVINSDAGTAQPLGARTTSPGIRLGSTDFSESARGTLRYTGTESVELGKTIRLTEGSQGGIDVTSAGADLTISSVISIGDTAASLHKTGPGRLILAGTNTYAGLTVIEEGVIRTVMDAGLGQGGATDNQATRVLSGAALEVAGGISVNDRLFLNGSGVNEAGALRNVGGTNTLLQTVVLESDSSIAIDSGRLTLNAAITGDEYGLVKGGAGTMVLTADSAVTNLTVAEGVLEVPEWAVGAETGQPLGTGPVTLGSANRSGTIRLTDTNISNFAREKAVILAAGGSGVLDVAVEGQLLRLGGDVSGSGALVKAGAGDLRLEGAKTYTGRTILEAGRLIVTNDVVLGMAPTGSTPDQLVLNGGRLDLVGNGLTLHANRGLEINGGALELFTDITAAQTVTVASAMSGEGGFIKLNTGLLRVEGPATHQGQTELHAGRLFLSSINNEAALITHTNTGLNAIGSVGSLVISGKVSTVRGEGQGQLVSTNLVLADNARIDLLQTAGVRQAPLLVNGDLEISGALTVNVSRVEGANLFAETPIIAFTGSATTNSAAISLNLDGFDGVAELVSIQTRSEGGTNLIFLSSTVPENDVSAGSFDEDDKIITLTAATQSGLSYDLIYMDSPFFNPTGTWALADRKTATGVTTELTNYVGNIEHGNTRFYRISPLGAWNSPEGRLVSPNVYMVRPITVRKGDGQDGVNRINFGGVPLQTNMAGVFGLTSLPAGGNPAVSARVLFYEQSATNVHHEIWLANDTPNQWRYSRQNGEAASGPANDQHVNVGRGVSIVIPNHGDLAANYTFYFVGRLPIGTNDLQSFTLRKGESGLMSLQVPWPLGPSEMGLIEAGFTAPPRRGVGDWIYKIDAETQQRGTLIRRDGDIFRFFGSSEEVPAGYFQPDDGIGIYLPGFNGEEFTWTPPIPEAIAGITNAVLPNDPNIGAPGAGQPDVPDRVPVVQTGLATNITTGSVMLSGHVMDSGGKDVTARGFIWGATQGVSFENGTYVAVGSGTGSLSATLTNLMPNAQYYFRVVASNEVGQAVGQERSFWTLAKTPLAPSATNVVNGVRLTLWLEDENPPATEYVIQETGTGQYVTSSGSVVDGAAPWTPKSNFPNVPFITIVNSALPGITNASFVVRARNGALVETPPSNSVHVWFDNAN